MTRRRAGFTIIELMIALAIVTLVLAAASTFFIATVRQYKVQTKLTESNVEGILGLELLRQDVENLGFGLPWNNLTSYVDARAGVAPGYPSDLNDASNPPRAVVSIDCAAFTVNRSDYLVLKSAHLGMDNAAGKWTTLTQANTKRSWMPQEENIADADYVIVLRVGNTDANRRSLVTSGTFYTPFGSTSGFVPVEPYSANVIYGIGATQPRRPFNRAEYFIANAASVPPWTVPRHCAPNTGVLMKAVVRHDAAGTTEHLLPLLDCAADLQVVYGFDSDADGVVNSWGNEIPSTYTAANIRAEVAEVRLHILAQEGQRDDTYTFPTDNVYVGSEGAGEHFDLTGYRNYRWKVYSIVVKPKNLAQ